MVATKAPFFKPLGVTALVVSVPVVVSAVVANSTAPITVVLAPAIPIVAE